MTGEKILRTLRDLKATYKRDDLLLPGLERHVMRQSVVPDDERRSDVMHPSEMAKAKWCGRHDYYRIRGVHSTVKTKPDTFRRANQYEAGHQIHRKYQRWFWEMGKLWGRWECKDCGHRWMALAPEVCARCSSGVLEYKEVPLDCLDLNVVGHADGIVMVDRPNEYATDAILLEIKSIGINSLRFEALSLWEKAQEEQMTPEEIWFLIKRPFAGHIRQGMVYLYLVQLLYPEMHIDRISFIYEWKPTQEVKEFVVTYNESFIEGILNTVTAVNLGLAAGEPPERPEWAALDTKVCENCEYRAPCYGISPTSQASRSLLRVKRASIAARRRVVGS